MRSSLPRGMASRALSARFIELMRVGQREQIVLLRTGDDGVVARLRAADEAGDVAPC